MSSSNTPLADSVQPTAIDPVCGMTVNPATAKHHTEHAGKPYYFCHAGCMVSFKADPAKYLNKSSELVTLSEIPAMAKREHGGHGNHRHGHSVSAKKTS